MPDNIRSVLPDRFFNIEQPSTPWVSVQFRTRIEPNEDLESSAHWESITLNPVTLFNSVEIEDSGGAQQLSLSLYDKNFANLENLIVRSIVAARKANNLTKNPNYSQDEEEFFSFYVARNSSANLRIRFGYSQWQDENNPYIDPVSVDDSSWKSRAENNRTVIRSPWLYFQISGVEFDLKKEGLKAELKAFSVTTTFLDRAKLYESYAKITGHPRDIINDIGDIVNEVAATRNEQVEFRILDEPRAEISQEDGKEQIEIMLGSEPTLASDGQTIKMEERRRPLRRILDDICSKVKDKMYDEDGNEIQDTNDSSPDGSGIDEENEQIDKVVSYNYTLREENGINVIEFFYEDPNNFFNEFDTVRAYTWSQNSQSIVKELDIKTNTDFATLNVPIVSISGDGDDATMHVARGNNDDDTQDDEMDFSIGHIRNVSAALDDENFDAAFVSGVRNSDDLEVSNDRITPQQAGAIMSRKIVKQINDQIFSGSLSLFGDPFYLFDSVIKPFSYMIKVVVFRPSYIDRNGEFVQGEKSYLTGYYAIKKITHNISSRGFNTNLEVMRWPIKN